MRYLRLALIGLIFFTHSLFALEIFINRAFTTSEAASANLYASGEGLVFIRVYRIDDVAAYLAGQNNAHTIAEKNERIMQPGYLLWRSVFENIEHSLYQLVRRYMRADYRERLRKDLGLKKYAFPFRDRFPEFNLFQPLKYPIIAEATLTVKKRYWQSLRHQFGQLKAGYYLVEVSQGRQIAHAPLVISDVAMVTKTSPYNLLIFATNLQSQKPVVAGQVVAFTRNKDIYLAKQVFELKDGLFFSDRTEFLKKSENTLYMLKAGDHYAFSDLYAMDMAKERYEAAIYTDRPLYRIGDSVSVRGVFVKKQGKAAHGKVRYEIRSADDEVMVSGDADLSAAGSFNFHYKATQAKPGRYTIIAELSGEKHRGAFVIEQYKKPETRANLSVQKKVLLAGESTTVDLGAAYYSGEPLANTTAEIAVERAPIRYPWWYGLGYDEYYGDASDYQSWDAVKEFTATLDAKGKVSLTLPTDAKLDADYHYRVRATVKAQNREETQASARFKVYRSKVALRLTQERWYFSSATPIRFKVNATSIYDAQGLVVPLVAELFYRAYDAKLKKYIDTLVAQRSLTTTSTGEVEAEFAVAKKGGLYFVRVTATEGGRATNETLETYVFAAGEIWGEGESSERAIQVSANKKQFALGDTAEFAVRLPVAKKLPVLVTIENDRIRKFSFIQNTDANFVYKEILTANLSPNFELSVTALDFDKIPRLYSGSSTVIIPPQHRMLSLEVIADRARYRPGEQANIVVKTFDDQHRPVSAEFSLGVVDEAIYALREDSLKSLSLTLNPKLPLSVVTGNSLAFSFYGYGAEKSLYALYREQMTESAALRKGDEAKVKIRKNFKDTALFVVAGTTGTDGIGTVKVPLPDNLTEWRITTHAHTTGGLSGSERTRIVAAKDFALRLAQPRFLRERDEATLRLLVSNQLKEKQTAKLTTTLSQLKLAKSFPATLEIGPNEEKYIDFTVTAPFYPANGKASLQFVARAEKDSDGLEMQLPILPYGVENFVAAQKVFGDDEDAWSTHLKLDGDARSELAEMSISFLPGIIPSVVETLPYLMQYPYGCVEQTLSTFLPAIWATRAAKSLKLALPVKESEAKEITDAGLKKLYGYQHNDGGWGWWSDDPTDLYMTAYTLWGLTEASTAGIKVDQAIVAKGTKFLIEQLTLQAAIDAKDRYAAHRIIFAQSVALELIKKSAPQLVEKIHSEWANLLENNFAEPAALALMLRASGHSTSLKTKILTALAALQKQDAQGVYFENNTDNRYYWFNDREETTALVLDAALGLKKDTSKLPTREMVSFLVSRKAQKRWRSTKVSALIVRAFTHYARSSGEKLERIRVSAEVDGERRDTVFDPKKFTAKDLHLAFKTTRRESQIKVDRSGSGFFLARAEWKHYLNKPLITPRAGDFSVARKYFSLNKNGNRYTKGPARYAFKAGELLMTEISLKAHRGSEYLLVEDMIPAGFEPLSQQELANLGDIRWDNYMNSPSAVTRLDDRVALAKTYLGEDVFTPRAFYRAVFPGKYQAMPAQGGLMYYGETFAYSSSDVITITD